MPFKMREIYFFPEIKEICVPTLPKVFRPVTLNTLIFYLAYGKCSKISNTLKLRTPKIIAENIFQNILKNQTLCFLKK